MSWITPKREIGSDYKARQLQASEKKAKQSLAKLWRALCW